MASVLEDTGDGDGRTRLRLGAMSTRIDTPHMFFEYLRRVVKQLFAAAGLDDQLTAWEAVVLRIALKVCSNLELDIRAGDAMDIRHYVKIKQVSGGTPAASQYVSGIVFTKSIVRRAMNHPATNPRILLLNCAIEYDSTYTPLLSLSSLANQERQFLTEAVDRIVALRPDILVVHRSVAFIALELLGKHNITVVYNVKAKVMEELARCTGASIVPSLEKLDGNSRFGTCALFEPRTFVNPEDKRERKTYLYFSGCDRQSTCTIVLRGGSSEELRKIKRVVHLATMVAYNIKLESCFLTDMNADLMIEDNHSLYRLPKLIGSSSMLDSNTVLTWLEMYVDYFTKSCFSASPNVHFRPPIVLARLLASMRTTNAKEKAMETQKITPVTAGDVDVGHENFDVTKKSSGNDDLSKLLMKKLLKASPQEARPAIENIVSNVDLITPYTQQSLFVLYSSVCPQPSLPFQQPAKHFIEYYGDSDLTLGQYIEELCSQAGLICPEKGCENKLLNHVRSYLHSDGKLNIRVEEFTAGDATNQISMWSICQSCGNPSPIIDMRENTWKYSFGKFLELYFYSAYVRPCGHALFKDTILYFKFGIWVVKVDYEPITLYDIVVPPLTTRQKSHHDIYSKLRLKDTEVLQGAIAAFYDSIDVRIYSFSFEIVSRDKVEDAKKTMATYGKRAAAERKFFLQLVQEKLVSSAVGDMLALNEVYRQLSAKATAWDVEFNMFARQYVQLDVRGDLRKMTAVQLRKMFVDRDRPLVESSFTSNLGKAIGLISDPPQETPTQDKEAEKPEEDSFPLLGSSPTFEPMLEKLSSPISRTITEKNAENRLSYISEDGLVGGTSQQSTSPAVDVQDEQEGTLKRKMSIKFGDSFRQREEERHGRTLTESRIEVMSKSKSMDLGMYPFEKTDNYKGEKNVIPSPSIEEELVPTEVNNSSPFTGQPPKNGNESVTEYLESVPGSDSGVIVLPKSPPKSYQVVDVVDQSRKVKDSTGGKDANNPVKKPGIITQDLRKVLAKRPPQIDNPDDEVFADWNTISGVMGEGNLDIGSRIEISSTLPNISGTERSSIMKTLTTLWSGNAGFFSPLKHPLKSSEHLFSDSLVIVREEEPTSLIAYALSSKQSAKFSTSKNASKQSPAQPGPPSKKVDNVDIKDSTDSIKVDTPVEDVGKNGGKKAYLPDSYLKALEEDEDPDMKGAHLSLQFKDGSTKMSCTIFFADEFETLRKNCGIDETYTRSLSRCAKWDSSGGKSGSMFLKTRDDRFIVKQLSKVELYALFKFAPAYFEYMSKALFQNLPTVLTKIFGFYQLSYKNSATGKSVRLDCFVMENLLYDHNFTHIFDLKGSTRNRFAQATGKPNEVLLDDNLLDFLKDSPLCIQEHSKRLLRAALWNDTLFLSKLNVMDYSLLLGIDMGRKELVIGILDFVRTFTWDKKLESWVKETAFLGGGRNEPTILGPVQYKVRFRDAMDKYFLMVPDKFFLSPSVLE